MPELKALKQNDLYEICNIRCSDTDSLPLETDSSKAYSKNPNFIDPWIRTLEHCAKMFDLKVRSDKFEIKDSLRQLTSHIIHRTSLIPFSNFLPDLQ